MKNPSVVFSLILLGAILAMSLTGWMHYRNQKQAFERAKHDELSAVVALRIAQIDHCKHEHLAGANVLSQNSPLKLVAEKVLRNPHDLASRRQLLDWMTAFKEEHHYTRILLLDTQNRACLTVPGGREWVGPYSREVLKTVIANKVVKVTDLHVSEVSGEANVDLFVPVAVPSQSNSANMEVTAVFMIEVEVKDCLLPILQDIQGTSKTAQSFLIKPEKDKLLLVGDGRHGGDPAKNKRVPAGQLPDLISKAHLSNGQAIISRWDYCGKPVLAAARRIPGSEWLVLAKQDLAEIYEPLHKQAWATAATTGALILASICGLILIWRSREYGFTLRELEARKQAEDALRQTVARVHGFMAAAFEGICFHSDSRVIDANEQYARKFGYTRDELIGKPVFDFVVPEHRDLVARMLDSGSEEAYEHLALRKDGSTFTAEVRGKWVMWEGKQVKVAALRDISDRRRMEEALQSRIVALTQPMDSSAGITFNDLFDLEEIQRVQDSFSRVAGVASLITTPDGVALTRPSNFCRLCSEIIRKTEKGRANCMKSDACIGKHNPSGPIVQECLSGGLWDAGASITVGGKHIANWLVGQVRNERQHEEKMLRYASEIGADVEEFRSALHEVPIMSQERFQHIAETVHVLANELSLRAYQNCQQARFIAERQKAEADRERLLRELVRKNKELESVIYISSHDLRSPLVNIQGFSHRLKTGCEQIKGLLGGSEVPPHLTQAVQPILNDRVEPALGFISSSVLKMDGLLNGLLRLSRLGRTSLNPETLDMNKLARTAAESLAFQVQQAGASLKIDDLPPCHGDATQVSQIVSNLLDNAIKYRDMSRPLQISVRGELCAGECKYIVEDNGVGIPEDQREKVFEIFHRLNPASAVKGEGLGLSIVRRILDRHDGRAWVESAIGQGSRFFFVLPSAIKESPALSPGAL